MMGDDEMMRVCKAYLTIQVKAIGTSELQKSMGDHLSTLSFKKVLQESRFKKAKRLMPIHLHSDLKSQCLD